jgi:tetratricopeptide (TPR) repeat protein
MSKSGEWCTRMNDEQRPSWAVRLQVEREAHGWNKREMARRLLRATGHQYGSVDSLARQIRGWEAGEHFPRDWATAYATAFALEEGDLFTAQGDDGDGRPHRGAADVLADFLPDGNLSARIATITGQCTGASIVADLSARAHALRLADDVLAGGDLLAPAFRELDAAVRLYGESVHTEDVGRGLLSVIGEFAQIAGWVASDAGQHDRAAETYQLGIEAAREAEDGTLESNLVGSLAYQATNIGDPAGGVVLARAAVEAAGSDAPARARALAWDRLAWAHTRAQDAQATMRALGEASAALATLAEDGGDEPGYLYWFDAGELQIMEARAYTELRRPLRAVPILIDVLSRYDATHTRELALYLSWLAVALADANEPEEAAAAAGRMLELSTDVASERTAERARVVLARLEPYGDVPAVRELLLDRG